MNSTNIQRRGVLKSISVAYFTALAGCIDRPGIDVQETSSTHSETTYHKSVQAHSATNTHTASTPPTPDETAHTTTSPAETPTEALQQIRLELQPEQPEQDDLKWLKPLQFEDLPAGEREIVNAAIKSESYTERWPWSESLKSLVDRIEERKYSQIETYQEEHTGDNFPGYLDAVYIVKDEQYYHVFLVVKDVVVSA